MINILSQVKWLVQRKSEIYTHYYLSNLIRPIKSSNVFIIYLHKNNNKHFHFSDKRNKNLNLIPCDVTLQHPSKWRRAKFLMTSHCVNMFSRARKCIYLVKLPFFNAENVIKAKSPKRQMKWVVILVIRVNVLYRSDCGSPSGAGFYACHGEW